MKNLFKTKKSASFTMVELSIVLLVLGLLLAGALSVGGLIERARMQRILTEVDPLKKSFLMFKDTYGQYPLLSNEQCQQYSEFKPVISGASTSYIGGTGTPTYTAESSTRCGFSSGTTAINTNYPSNTSDFLAKGCYALRQMQWANLVSGVPLANAGGVCNWWATTGTPSFRNSSLVSKADNEMRIFFSELDSASTRFAYELYTGGNASYTAYMPADMPVIIYFSNKAMVGIKSATAAKISQKITGSENAYASRLFTGVKVLGVSSAAGEIAWRDGQSVSCTSLADNSTAIKNAAGYKGQGAVSYLKDGVCSLVFAIED
jgi:hypothetical protein